MYHLDRRGEPVAPFRTGSVEPYADLNLKHEIDAGLLPGPHIDVTGPYLISKEAQAASSRCRT
jgi:hypothetical protein